MSLASPWFPFYRSPSESIPLDSLSDLFSLENLFSDSLHFNRIANENIWKVSIRQKEFFAKVFWSRWRGRRIQSDELGHKVWLRQKISWLFGEQVVELEVVQWEKYFNLIYSYFVFRNKFYGFKGTKWPIVLVWRETSQSTFESNKARCLGSFPDSSRESHSNRETFAAPDPVTASKSRCPTSWRASTTSRPSTEGRAALDNSRRRPRSRKQTQSHWEVLFVGPALFES